MEQKPSMTFASVLKNPIYQRRDVLYALEPPEGFLHRNEEKNELVMELAPILMQSPVICAAVYGNPGTGKTGLILSLLKELEQEAQQNSIKLVSCYVNCSENRTETTILLELLKQLDSQREYPKMGWNRAKAVAEFERVLKQHANTQLVFILDEVDYVLREAGDDVLYRLSRIHNKTKTNVSTIIISNDVRVDEYIKPKTQSSLGRVKIVFRPYNEQELYDIIRDRAKYGFKKNVVSDQVLRKVAQIESQRDGDARRALELLDSCAKMAVARQHSKITLEHVNEADSSLERDSVLSVVKSLTQHQKLVYYSILKQREDRLAGMDVFRQYKETCQSYNMQPLSERRVRSLVINLNDLGLIRSEVGWLADLKKKTRKIEVTLDSALKNKVVKMLRDSI
ncbi:TPA: AAA family ATPase [Candidatus Woesearchaeota archaeon]|nr:AAA family ATPase [Candidatus Woesearchaeota archaeon]HIH46779.1 AAA family ATPase [Candidatus Woesearchaeota archaeon]